MNFDWQNLTALGLVSAAGFYLARASWAALARRKQSGCGSCGTCPSNKPGAPPLVSIGSIERAPVRREAVPPPAR